MDNDYVAARQTTNQDNAQGAGAPEGDNDVLWDTATFEIGEATGEAGSEVYPITITLKLGTTPYTGNAIVPLFVTYPESVQSFVVSAIFPISSVTSVTLFEGRYTGDAASDYIHHAFQIDGETTAYTLTNAGNQAGTVYVNILLPTGGYLASGTIMFEASPP